MPGSRPLEFIILIKLEIWPRSSLFLTASLTSLLRWAQVQSPFFLCLAYFIPYCHSLGSSIFQVTAFSASDAEECPTVQFLQELSTAMLWGYFVVDQVESNIQKWHSHKPESKSSSCFSYMPLMTIDTRNGRRWVWRLNFKFKIIIASLLHMHFQTSVIPLPTPVACEINMQIWWCMKMLFLKP